MCQALGRILVLIISCNRPKKFRCCYIDPFDRREALDQRKVCPEFFLTDIPDYSQLAPLLNSTQWISFRIRPSGTFFEDSLGKLC